MARWRKIIALLRFNSGLLIPDIEKDVQGMLEALRKPAEGIERPKVTLEQSLILARDFRPVLAYIDVLEAENQRLRAALRSANDPTHGHPDETDDRAMDRRLGAKP